MRKSRRELLFALFASGTISPVFAASYSFECDTPAGRYSTVQIPITSPGVEVVGEILVNEVRLGSDWAPAANVLVHNGQLEHAVGLRAFLYQGEESQLSLNIQGADREDVREFGVHSWKGRVVHFKLIVTRRGEVTLEAGGSSAKMASGLTGASTLALLCSSGDFSFGSVTVAAHQ